MNQEPVQSRIPQYKTLPGCSTVEEMGSNLHNLMRIVMRRNGTPHWTEELKAFHKLYGEKQ